ncbi:acyltransferase family protein [Sporomusa malonica]|uniref:Surface polysaccharide O-acyltransferase, integral membrane enzyme n=1 Tax=Sporomusa malonica TaxID=112901 RepID=A0A1W1ZN27_9FIRM|nr:acyltransferase family protein [Sporomusa malonica]SMC49622.1 Surface polysaccharide O-acyltransferase, integral membrane enzyme [Sporomusa malonica]
MNTSVVITPTNPPKTGLNRIYFLDNLRATIIIIVVLFHSAIPYMIHAPNDWYVISAQKNIIFDIFVAINDVYMMPIMFLAAGYFALPSLRRKSFSSFWIDKTRRLIIPWIFGVIFLQPVIKYFRYLSRDNADMDLQTYLHLSFLGGSVSQGHFWFLGALALVFFGLSLLFLWKRPLFQQQSAKIKQPSALLFIVFGIITSLGFFVVSIISPDHTWEYIFSIVLVQPTRFVLYVCYFALGLYAYQNLWFTAQGYRPRLKTWLFPAIMCVVVFLLFKVTYPVSTTLWVKLANGFIHAFCCLCLVFALLGFFEKYLNFTSNLWDKLVANSFAFYFVHELFVVALGYLTINWSMPLSLKYLNVAILSIIISYVLCEHGIRRVSFLRKFF